MGCDIHIVAETKSNNGWRLAYTKIPDDRNYWTFGILANVRNGSGFAGVDMGDPLTPISEPRGLPDDMSTETKSAVEHDEIWLGDHSFSWLTLRELLDYPYDGLMVERGMVDKKTAAAFRATGKPPEEWCGDTTAKEWVRLEWQRPLREAAKLFGKIIETISPLGDPDSVRIVFGFDS